MMHSTDILQDVSDNMVQNTESQQKGGSEITADNPSML